MGRRDDWERDLFAIVPDEVAQDALNAHYLGLEVENAKLRELADHLVTLIRLIRDTTCAGADQWECLNRCPLRAGGVDECAMIRAWNACERNGIEVDGWTET